MACQWPANGLDTLDPIEIFFLKKEGGDGGKNKGVELGGKGDEGDKGDNGGEGGEGGKGGTGDEGAKWAKG